MPATNHGFDSDEYLHLAMESIRRGDHGAALAHLKEGTGKFPQDPRLAYLLGAEHAQIGLFDRAEEEMSRAVQLDPLLHTARFQLGLLQMTRAKPLEARATWQDLDALPDGHALRCFRDGLLALAADRYDEARSHLQAGLQANDFSEPLNRDIENLLARFPDQPPTPAPENTEGTGHLWLNAYQDPNQST